ncbi:MAG: DUF4846 domain-containing protein [Byssovorax sp.]
MRRALAAVAVLLIGCTSQADPPLALRAPDLPARVEALPAVTAAPQPVPSSTAVTTPTTPALDRSPAALAARYPWPKSRPDAPAGDRLERRFPTPSRYVRAAVAPGSFGAWLRDLPLEADRTPVLSHRGAVVLGPDHPNLAAVVAIDVGAQDLQQCADSVIRLHAEWQWSQSRRDESYRAASGAEMPFARWAHGERITVSGPAGSKLTWAPAAKADDTHAAFRAYLDGVFGWANTVSLARDTTPIALADLRAGDFVVQPGGPGHAVLILDLATNPEGQRLVLLGQGFMPAQSFQVLHPGKQDPHVTLGANGDRGAWFPVDPEGLQTPFWPRFPWTALHRFPAR